MLDVRGGVGLLRNLCNEALIMRPIAFITLMFDRATKVTFIQRATVAKHGLPGGDAEQSREALSRVQKMESLGRLTAGVAHDFNNLLTVVLGNAAALRIGAEARGDAEAIRRAELIERAAERGGRLAGQLLAFSGKQMLRPETTSAYRVISSMTDMLAQVAGESVRIRLHAAESLWKCRVDPGQLEAAILNLVLNARDAMPDGGNVVIICENQKVRSASPGMPGVVPGDYVRINIGDTGCGIAPELMDKVLEPFFTTKPVGQGSGLGLAQVYGFAGQSGGWMELESAVGHGTTVSLYLPRDKGRRTEPESRDNSVAPVGQNRTILVVEPDSTLRTTSCEVLALHGYRTLEAANGSSALAHLVSDERIHLLATEAALPGGVSGVELGRSALQVRPDIGVLITSGTLKEAPTEARQTGRKGSTKRFELLMKPYRPADIVSVVGAILSRDTFSTATEEILADVRKNLPLLPSPGVAQAGAAAEAPVVEKRTGQIGRRSAIRLGVMPFRTIGSNTDAAFSIGLAEEITTAFARFRTFTCVAPASVAALSDEPRGQTDRWRQLDLDFLVEGSFRKKGDEIQVLLRLVNMRGAGEITWGRRFDSLMPDVLNLHDQIASETAARVVPELLVWEGHEITSRPRVDPTAYDLMLRAIPAIYRLDEGEFRKAGVLLEASLERDPSNAGCYSWLAHWYLFSLGQGWTSGTVLATERADHLSQHAVTLDPEDARGFTVAGHVKAFLHREAEAALWLHERAITLNPSLAMAWCYYGLAHCYLGQHAEALRRIQHAQRLSPHDPHGFFFESALTMPLLLAGQHEAAAAAGRRARHLNPAFSSTYKTLLAALGHLGATVEAQQVRKALLVLEPRFSITAALARSPLLRPEDRQRYVAGLRSAGVPEHVKG